MLDNLMEDFSEKDTSEKDKREDEREYVERILQSFLDCYTLRNESLEILGNRTPDRFWQDCERDYAVVLDEVVDPNDPVHRYQSTISRDKSNVFIAHITGALAYPDVVAQNGDQGIDRVWSRVGSSLLYWAHKQDGWPIETGQQRAERVGHSTVVKGTAFSLDKITKDGLDSEEVPVEEIFVPNLWQPNIQKQSVVFRAKLNVTYSEAEALFGDLPNFGRVEKGTTWLSDTFIDNDGLKNGFNGIIQEDKVSILYVWEKTNQAQLKELKSKRKLYQSATRGTFYNVIINGIPMFEVGNTLPYKHGFVPISKCIFEAFRSDFFYGNSVPNKMREDKKWRDDWKTLMRFKGKLGALPPQLIIGGSIDDQIILPSAQTSVPEGVTVQAVPGIQGITNSDIQLMQMADSEIDRATVAPSASGQQPNEKQTARAEVIQAAASEKLLEPFVRQYGYYMQSRSFPILMSLLQFISRKSIQKIVVPDQTLSDGQKGQFEIIFQDVSTLDEIEALKESMSIRDKQIKSREQKSPKDIAYVSPKMISDLKFFLFSDSSMGMGDRSLVRQQEFMGFLQNVLLNRPDLADASQALQYLFDIKGWPTRILKDAEGAGGYPQGISQNVDTMMGQASMESSPGQTDGDLVANAASKATVGSKLPNLA